MEMDKEKALKVMIAVLVVAILFAGAWGVKTKKDRALKAYEELAVPETEDEEAGDASAPKTDEESLILLCIDICGAVENEGYYELPAGSRMVDAVEIAGGLLETADARRINLAQKIHDQQKIIVPEIGENTADEIELDGLVNINTAGKTALESLAGIGPVYAERIISYRENNGGFKTKEDIMKIKGIGEKTFEGIEECICVY